MQDESNLDLGLQLSTGWVPETMAAVKRMSAQALVAHAAIQQLGQSPTGKENPNPGISIQRRIL